MYKIGDRIKTISGNATITDKLGNFYKLKYDNIIGAHYCFEDEIIKTKRVKKKKVLLNKTEKNYLKSSLKVFDRDEIRYIKKEKLIRVELRKITYYLPLNGLKFTGMKRNKEYSIKELGV